MLLSAQWRPYTHAPKTSDACMPIAHRQHCCHVAAHAYRHEGRTTRRRLSQTARRWITCRAWASTPGENNKCQAVRSRASQGVKARQAEAPGHMHGKATELNTGCAHQIALFTSSGDWLSYLRGWWTYSTKKSWRSPSQHDKNGDVFRSEFVGTCWSRAAAAMHTR